ncbi:uncharacterized protein N7484_001062 [Penicillium longicatenatum]|uniref:uncharacterized protein n=1 Tax=Penicillium longicatenatum TaxID=1561947 RepID=UPI002547FCC3|nr:uncharacterized protein N7484_001062 [Penicillium longicatenatum]KAJ5657413.1 hypothetical protein N7484_001062 [Penicillium longicatenatum]
MHSRILQLPLRAPIQRLPIAAQLPIRHASTAAPQSPSGRSRWTRRLIYASIFGVLGIAAGGALDSKISAPPPPGSPEDRIYMKEIEAVYEGGLPIVQELRQNPDWEESGVYQGMPDESRAHRLTSKALAGSRGIALQRVFSNAKEKKVVSVVYLGSGLEGWPTMIHGGALATVIDENMGRAAIRHFPERTGVTANMDLNYRAPVYSGLFYTFHTRLDQERSTDRKAYTICEVRDLTGKVCVEATGLFVVPKKFKLASIGERF